jgi:hypothetical protein
LTTKTRLACEQGQKVLSMIVTAGHRGDSPQFIPVLRRIEVNRRGVKHALVRLNPNADTRAHLTDHGRRRSGLARSQMKIEAMVTVAS